MRIGILGGTFDPIHVGHIELAKAAVSELSLDKVLVIPAGNPYFKSGKRDISLGIHRYNMIKLSIAPYPYMEALDIELYKEGETYTADTLLKLDEKYRGDELFFIVGSDSLLQMDTWYKPGIIFDLSTIVCGVRSNDIIEDKIALLRSKYNADIHVLSDDFWKGIEASSSNIRLDIDGREELVDLRVKKYIDDIGLYSKTLTTEQIINRLKIELKESRFKHTLSVAETAKDLALVHGYAYLDKAYIAGLLHDVGKPYAGALEHAAKGVEIARKSYGIEDEDVLLAISSHTVGRCGMSMLEKIVFLADFIEPLRREFDDLEEIRALSYIDLDRAIVKAIESTIEYLNETSQRVDEKTLDVYNYYRNKTKPI